MIKQRAARKALKDSGQLPEPPFPWVAMTVVFSVLITAALFSWGII